MIERPYISGASERRRCRRQPAGFWQELRAGFREELRADFSRLLELELLRVFSVGPLSRRTPQLQLRPIAIQARSTIVTSRGPKGQYR
jgi:hypothetical protein